MDLLNIVEIEAENRYVSLEIYKGDLTKITFSVDLLITSSFIDSYTPSKNTLIGALYQNLSININELSLNKTFDFRDTLNCWLTNQHNSDIYKWILVLEMKSLLATNYKENTLNDIFKKMFISINILEQLGKSIKTIALPILGSGLQNIHYAKVINSLLAELKTNLTINKTIERVLFIEYSSEKALLLSDSLDNTLGRAKIDLPVDSIIINIKEEIINLIKNNRNSNRRESNSFKFLEKTFNNDKAKSIEYGIACRRITESIITEQYFIGNEYSHMSFLGKIRELSNVNVANWIISYLHVIRIFGNESAHDINADTRVPSNIISKDISLLLFCVLRVVEFWNSKTG